MPISYSVEVIVQALLALNPNIREHGAAALGFLIRHRGHSCYSRAEDSALEGARKIREEVSERLKDNRLLDVFVDRLIRPEASHREDATVPVPLSNLMEAVMPTIVRTARIFISSTFRDMHSERDRLVRYVFPTLDERCRKLNVRVLPLDLRWGVTEEEAEQGKALEICLDEIDRARPFFVGLLGERYGSVPDQYETADHARFDWLKDPDLPGHSITALEIIHGVLRHQRQRRRSFFYFRDPGFSAQVPEAFRADFAAENETSRASLKRLKSQIHTAYGPQKAGLIGFLHAFRKPGSASRDSRADHLREYPAFFGGIRVDGDLAETDVAPDELEALRRLAPGGLVTPEAWAGLGDDDRRLVVRHGHVAVTGLEKPLAELILEDLWGAIQAEFPPVKESRDALTQERDRHLAFVSELTRVVAEQVEGTSYAPSRIFVGRNENLKQLEDYVLKLGQEGRPLIVLGRSGSGKTSLLAELASRLEKKAPGLFVVPVFAGLTPASRPVGEVLERITAELKRRYGFEVEELNPEAQGAFSLESPSSGPGMTAEKRVRAFQSALWKAAERTKKQGPAVILIDAADQMLDTGEGGVMSWLPAVLPSDVKIVVSAVEGTPPAQAARVRQLLIQPLEPLTREEAVLAIQRHLKEYRKQLGYDKKRGVDQLELFLSKADIALPLYLAAACEELRVHPRFETLSPKIESLPGGVADLLDAVLVRIEADHGADLASSALSLIACSGEGLTEPELLGLLSDAFGRTVPVARWTALRRSLAVYLRGASEDEGGRYFFFHRLLEVAVRRRYLSTGDAERRTYALLADAGLRELDRSLGLTPEEREAQPLSPLVARVGYSLFKADRDGDAELIRHGDLNATLVETLLRLLRVEDEAWPWYRAVFDTLIALVQRSEDECARLEERLLTLDRRLVEGPERAWARMATFVHETGEALRLNGFSLLAGCLFRSQKDLVSQRLAAYPSRGDFRRDLSLSLTNLGKLAQAAGRSNEALRFFEESLEITRALLASEPQRVLLRADLAVCLDNLGGLARAAGRNDEALRFFEESLAVLRTLVTTDPDHQPDLRRDLSVSLSRLGGLAQAVGRSDDAWRFFHESLEVMRILVAAEPHRADFRHAFAMSLNNLGKLAQAAGRSNEALRLFEEDLEVMRALVAAEPHRADLRLDLSASLSSFAALAQANGRSDKALRLIEEGLEVRRTLVAAEPQRADLRRDLAASLNNLGELAQAAGRSNEAQGFFEESLEVRRALVAAEPQSVVLRVAFSTSLNNLGELAQATGRSDEALPLFMESLEVRRALVAAEPAGVDLRRDLSRSLNNLGNLAQASGRNDEASQFRKEDVEIARALVVAEPHRADFRRDLSSSLNNLGTLAAIVGRGDEARQCLEESLALRRALFSTEPHRADLRRDLSTVLANLGAVARDAGRSDEALRLFEESLGLRRALITTEPHRSDLRWEFCALLDNLGELAQATGRSAEALPLFEESLDVMRALVTAEPYRADLVRDFAISCYLMCERFPASDHIKWLTEARDILQGFRSRGFQNAEVDQLWGLVAERMAGR